ncbi:Short-chain dehydrogenase [Nocardioides scoriae]|uniref:Short-chain dehydrogenase n=1 Tax=Nocardioides scoriae TaxID=642780 RepID=A0A1H1PCF7_9ACTN|nr:SDR family NAD(P)-dependent oxidoreductase [Nocardioides scoriae]SDS08961.1 Short-chain dehydrogenase [Nocardioides scoriae]
MTVAGPARRVLVTGASSGIGRATAHRLATEGARLVLVSRSVEVLEEVARECTARGAAEVLVVPADVGDHAAVDAALATAVAAYDGIDGVVHAAGVAAYGRFQDVPPEVFEGVVRTNLVGTANVARASLRVFEERGGGSLVLLGSVLGKIATPWMSPYAVSKWGVAGLARSLQIEARRLPGTRVTLVSPGGVDTPIYDLAATVTGHAGNPPPPVTTPERVAAACVRGLDQQRRDVDVGRGNKLMVTGFRRLPGVFDRLVTPLMDRFGQDGRTKPATTGNVLAPARGEAVRGRWPHVWGQLR